ncbi:activating signal cointegrator 1 complex subunit 1 isoform X2 [Ooceraea biroi]|uniref:Activating signal cointegrator 1 complex subunit n=3 Tax=Ooceraea biroi TaxID=2015173 RepID=A0A026WMD7_OOCBI|nr:activating signal cointegrator 1 complex subunit 1 isoform X2 [Ooceraea biroi]EZA56279.1 Activating signal cointegrator 1 complex subunit [Ooceraea biroi]
MDVLEPELVWINGRCYRFYESSAWKNMDTSAPYVEDEELVSSEDESDTDIEIVSCGTMFKHTFYVPTAFYANIIGAKGSTRKRLESETGTTIEVPRKGKVADIAILGRDRKAIISARHRIDLLIEDVRKKKRYTHFLSIPLNKQEIIDNFNSFKTDVLEKYAKSTRNIDESLFQTASKLHITIGMLKLFDDNEKKQAFDVLNDCKEKVIKPILEESEPLKIQLRGVECMNDDPTEVKVLFAKISQNDKLQKLVDETVNHFVDFGLMKKERENVKLHATLMNVSFKDDHSSRFKEKIDATEIFKDHKETLFGEITLNQIDISELGTASKNNYYKSIGSITI